MQKLSDEQQQIIENVKQHLKKQFLDEPTGHDWWHIYRVYKMACTLSDKANQRHNRYIVELGALLHDIADWKFHDGDETEGPRQAETLLNSLSVEIEIINQVKAIIKEISFKGADVETPMSTFEGEIVQDADRLDALGAVGIARTFAYGGKAKRPMHDPDSNAESHSSFADYKNSKSSSVNHFYEKLLLLKDRMNTDIAKVIAQHRHEYMQNFLNEFYSEWDGKK